MIQRLNQSIYIYLCFATLQILNWTQVFPSWSFSSLDLDVIYGIDAFLSKSFLYKSNICFGLVPRRGYLILGVPSSSNCKAMGSKQTLRSFSPECQPPRCQKVKRLSGPGASFICAEWSGYACGDHWWWLGSLLEDRSSGDATADVWMGAFLEGWMGRFHKTNKAMNG